MKGDCIADYGRLNAVQREKKGTACPLISIITVTKNCAPTIARTLESVKSIKSNDIEYLIIDGMSTDGTLRIIDQFPGLVDRLVSETDSGIYNAMNKGAALASGRYILFVNGDDHIIPEGFVNAIAILMAGKPEILSCQAEARMSDETHLDVLRPNPRMLYFYNSIPHPSTFVSAGLQNKYKFREDLKIASDYDLFLRLFLNGHCFMVSNAMTAVHYRGGCSGNVDLSLAELRQIKRERLGWARYVIVRFIEVLHRGRKSFSARLKRWLTVLWRSRK